MGKKYFKRETMSVFWEPELPKKSKAHTKEERRKYFGAPSKNKFMRKFKKVTQVKK